MSRWNALRAYSALPSSVGYWFLAITFIGRIPATMGQLGSLLLVSSSTGSLAWGGATAAVFALGQAVGGPMVGVLADRAGHRPVGLAAATLHSLSLASLVLFVEKDAALYMVLLAAAAAGLSVPQVGPLSRARWTALVRDRRLPVNRFPVAMSFEGTGDEFAFVLGPAVVGVIAAAASPRAAVLVAVGLTLTVCVAFALHSTASLSSPQQQEAASQPAHVVRRAPVLLLALGLVGLGCYFGSVQAAVTWRAVDAGSAGSAGLIYAVLGLSSAVAGAMVPMLPSSFPLTRRLQTGFILLTLLSVPLVFVGGLGSGDLWVLGVLIVCPGIPIGPILVTSYTLGEMTVPIQKISWVMTVLTSSVVIGYAIGSMLSGTLAERHGPLAAFLTALAAAGFGATMSVFGQRRLTALKPGVNAAGGGGDEATPESELPVPQPKP